MARLRDLCGVFVLLSGLGASGVACYQMQVHPVSVGAIAPIERCRDVIVKELARIGYHPIERVIGDHAVFSRELTWQNQTPISIVAPPPIGGVIGLRLGKRKDGGCAVELQGESYDCMSDTLNSAYRRCELTPGAPPEVDADIRTVIAAFRAGI